jgi:hypothetical protein
MRVSFRFDWSWYVTQLLGWKERLVSESVQLKREVKGHKDGEKNEESMIRSSELRNMVWSSRLLTL